MPESEGSPRQVDVSAAQRGRLAEPGLLSLLPDCLQLGDRLEVLPAPGGALQADQGVKGHAQAVDAEHVDGFGVFLEVFVPSAPEHLTQEVEGRT